MSIKVWNIASQTPIMQHCIPTMESVSKIRWSYGNKNHIASCSLKRDYNINIWNILRPYIAYARFTEPHEITTGMAWRRNLNDLISVTSNGILHLLPMSDAYRPLEHANPVGMAINPDGDIALALGNGLLRVNNSNISQTSSFEQSKQSASSNYSTNVSQSGQLAGNQQQSSLPNKLYHQVSAARSGRQSLTRRSQDSALSPRISSRSQLDVYKCTQMNWFVKTAQEYKLSNLPLGELCDHNAEVCAKLKRFQICQTWKILKLFYANISQTNSNHSTNQVHTSVASTSNNLITSNRYSSSYHQKLDDQSNGSQLHVDTEIPYLNKNTTERNSLIQQTVTLETTLDDDGSIAGSEQTNESTDDWVSHETLSYEAFQPKHDICGQVDKLMDKRLDDSRSISDSSNHEDDDMTSHQLSNLINTSKAQSTPIDNEHDLKISHLVNPKAYQFKFYEIIADVIADVLKYHVDNSDVQSAVSILIVLGDRIKNIVNERIPEVDRESWYHSYIDLLSKFQLWNVMAQVINLSPLQNINSINQTSTTIYTTCGTCNRPLNGRVGWICERCKTKPSECSVCHGVVSGLMAWCQGCYHGGHLIHMSRWFSENDYCPTGCGHLCELSQWR